MGFGLRERYCDEPKEEVFSVCDIEVARVLFYRRITNIGLPRPELVVGEGRVFNQLDFTLARNRLS